MRAEACTAAGLAYTCTCNLVLVLVLVLILAGLGLAPQRGWRIPQRVLILLLILLGRRPASQRGWQRLLQRDCHRSAESAPATRSHASAPVTPCSSWGILLGYTLMEPGTECTAHVEVHVEATHREAAKASTSRSARVSAVGISASTSRSARGS